MFDGITYLETGNERQQRAYSVLKEHAVFDTLNPYTPLLTGTIPIAIDIPGSDLDIICYWTNREQFVETLIENFSSAKNFRLHQINVRGWDTIICNFKLDEFPVEVFGQNRPSKEQEAYRHMVVEYRILDERGDEFRKKIIALKTSGLKTEPAFAEALGLQGDPYDELLKFDGW